MIQVCKDQCASCVAKSGGNYDNGSMCGVFYLAVNNAPSNANAGVLKSLKMQMKSNWQIFPLKRGLDFVGYRFFKGYTLLRKRILTRAKKLANKINPNLNAFYAYLGFLAYCNGFRLYLLYFAVHHRIFARYPRFLLKH